jgi:hypothetical protein
MQHLTSDREGKILEDGHIRATTNLKNAPKIQDVEAPAYLNYLDKVS